MLPQADIDLEEFGRATGNDDANAVKGAAPLKAAHEISIYWPSQPNPNNLHVVVDVSVAMPHSGVPMAMSHAGVPTIPGKYTHSDFLQAT
jgi:hypothetical protein